MIKSLFRKTLWTEPLVHFLIIGALVFGGHSLWQAARENADRTITVTGGDIERLSAIWESQAGRPPSAEDIKAILSEYVREEVLYREALRFGLEREDTIIRRRLAQKMGFVLDRAGVFDLTEDELRAVYEADPQAYARPDVISFSQIPFNFAADDTSRTADIEEALRALQSSTPADWMDLGDPFLLSRQHDALTKTDAARLFGRAFAEEVFAVQKGQWTGPVRSRLANHIVRVDRVDLGGVPEFEDIVEDIRLQETERRRRAANECEMTRLLEQYTIILNGADEQ